MDVAFRRLHTSMLLMFDGGRDPKDFDVYRIGNTLSLRISTSLEAKGERPIISSGKYLRIPKRGRKSNVQGPRSREGLT